MFLLVAGILAGYQKTLDAPITGWCCRLSICGSSAGSTCKLDSRSLYLRYSNLSRVAGAARLLGHSLDLRSVNGPKIPCLGQFVYTSSMSYKAPVTVQFFLERLICDLRTQRLWFLQCRITFYTHLFLGFKLTSSSGSSRKSNQECKAWVTTFCRITVFFASL